ncbi:MAG: sensor signal transduction histidine kinase [Acidobacteria bacterium]|nr:sensor signal transduction histidine kinase [Acidobacteriota bacterium]
MKTPPESQRSRLLAWVVGSARIVLVCSLAWGVAHATAAGVLTNTAQIRSLSGSEVELSPSIRVRGIITFSYFQWQLLFIHDGLGGCYVYLSSVRTNIPAGRWVEVEGSAGKGTHGPIIYGSDITVLPQPDTGAEMPRPRPMGLHELAAGRDDAQWIETSGVVRRATVATPGWHLLLGTPTAQVTVYVINPERAGPPTEWVNNLVRVRGVCTVTLGQNQRRQTSLFCSSSSDLTLEPPASVALLQEPAHFLRELPGFAQKAIAAHRIRVKGRGLGLRSLSPGDAIEASGFISQGEDGLELLESQVRKEGSGLPPIPAEIGPSIKLSTNDQARLLNVKCSLLQSEPGPDGDRLTVTRLGTGEGLVAEVPAALPGEEAGFFESGSVLELTGIWTTRSERGLSGTLICRNARDVTLLRQPSWWTARRITTVLGTGAATTLVAVLWAVSLRRQVRTQTEQIRRQFEQEAALERRYLELFANANDALLVLDAQGGIIELNPAAEKILQGSRQDLLGQPFRDRLAANDQRKLDRRLEKPLSDAADEPFELELVGRDGQRRILEVTSCRCRGDTGSVHFQLIAHDITARKQSEVQLAKLNLDLYQTSRQAGMAEVATTVLHNVGNVLNSVNVSATLLGTRLRKTHVAENLAKSARLMEEHASDLGRFLSEDDRGRQLPGYLKMLAQHLSTEHGELREEARHLASNVEHIKEIVAMQQSYAKFSGVLEPVSLAELAESALRIHADALARHRVELVREFEPVPLVMMDKHKALQILVNVLHNAKQACNEGGASARKVVVRIRPAADDTVLIEVSDNGIGIAPENLTRIFSHGFTTRKGGHGFGLHSAALAAKEMGGSLTAHSDGLGKGATFVLRLPLRPVSTDGKSGGSPT